MEAIPNKITDTMGIVADVNLLYENELQYIEIIVDKYPAIISYHGKYFYRSGSIMRTITGKELDKAILKSQGRTWDGMPISKLKVEDLMSDAIELFKEKAVRRGRLTLGETRVEDSILMDNLHLIDEDGYIIRAAMLAFYKDPEKMGYRCICQNRLFCTVGCRFKISGRFETSLKQVLKQKDYKKLEPVIKKLADEGIISIQEVTRDENELKEMQKGAKTWC